MTITAVITVAPSLVSGVHLVNQIELNRSDKVNFKVRVNHFPTEKEVSGGSLNWQSLHEVPFEALLLVPEDPFASVEQYLIANTELYGTGVYSEGEVSDTLESARAKAIATVSARYSAEVSVLTKGYPPVEQASWPFQVEEARALALDPEASAPLLTAAAAERQLDETPEELAGKVLAINTPYRSAYGTLMGIYQRLERKILAEEDIDVVKTISWPASAQLAAKP